MKRVMAAVLLLGGAMPFFVAQIRPAYACPPPLTPTPLEELVNSADLIAAASVTELFVEPPLDPAAPDGFLHNQFARLEVFEYLKGQGPATMAFPTGVSYSFTETGELDTFVEDCPDLRAGPVGANAVLLLEQDGESLAILESRAIDDPYGQAYLQAIRDILSAALTPTPAPVAVLAAATPDSPGPAPAALPGTGASPGQRDPSPFGTAAVAGSALGAAALLAISGCLVRRRPHP